MRNKKKMLLILIILFCIDYSTGYSDWFESEKPAFTWKPLSESGNIDQFKDFMFTISPNDRWLVYFENTKKSTQRLCVMDLTTRKVTKFDLPKSNNREIDGTNLLVRTTDECWSQDSRYCVIPAPNKYAYSPRRSPSVIIDIGSPDNPTLTYNAKSKGEAITYINLNQGKFTCSDCYDKAQEVNLLTQNISTDYLYIDRQSIPPSTSRVNIISKDGTKLYYTRGRGTNKAALHEFDIARKRDSKIISFSESCVQIQNLRLSPNQRYLSYQVEAGCGGWGASMGALYFFDLSKMINYFVAPSVYEIIHWNSTSTSLYFQKCTRDGSCGSDSSDHLYYIDTSTLK